MEDGGWRINYELPAYGRQVKDERRIKFFN
jgi:hypothetical protein